MIAAGAAAYWGDPYMWQPRSVRVTGAGCRAVVWKNQDFTALGQEMLAGNYDYAQKDAAGVRLLMSVNVSYDETDKGFTLMGRGFCRPPESDCDKASSGCRVNGFHKTFEGRNQDSVHQKACRDMCKNTPTCIGYAIASRLSWDEGDCYVHTSKEESVPTGWTAYVHQYVAVGQSSGSGAVLCFRKD